MKPARAFTLLLVLLLTSCGNDGPPASVPDDGGLNVLASAWVATEPTQCLTNSWEQDWLAAHDGDYAAYPKGREGTLTQEEIRIITDYYERQGVVVYAATSAPKYQTVCLACSCPEGHTLFLQVRSEDVATMLALGYRQEDPPGAVAAMDGQMEHR